MFEKPTPLREALREAIEDLENEAGLAEDGLGDRDLVRARARVDALIEQIPIVFEARDDDDTA